MKTIAKLIRGACDGLRVVFKAANNNDKRQTTKKKQQKRNKKKQTTTRPESINNSFGVSGLLRLGLVLCEGDPFIGQHLMGCCSQIATCKTFVLPNKRMMSHVGSTPPPRMPVANESL